MVVERRVMGQEQEEIEASVMEAAKGSFRGTGAVGWFSP